MDPGFFFFHEYWRESNMNMSDSDEDVDGIDMNDPPGLFESETYSFEREINDELSISPIEREIRRKQFFENLHNQQISKETKRSKELKELDVGFKLMQLGHEKVIDIITIRMQAHKTIASLVFLQRVVRGYLTRRAVKQSILLRRKQQELERENVIRRICDSEHTKVEKLRLKNESLRVRKLDRPTNKDNTR